MAQTDRSQKRGVGWGEWGGLEEISQRTYMHTCIAHGHRQECGEGWDVVGGGGGKMGVMGNICNSVHKKIILASLLFHKKKIDVFFFFFSFRSEIMPGRV